MMNTMNKCYKCFHELALTPLGNALYHLHHTCGDVVITATGELSRLSEIINRLKSGPIYIEIKEGVR